MSKRFDSYDLAFCASIGLSAVLAFLAAANSHGNHNGWMVLYASAWFLLGVLGVLLAIQRVDGKIMYAVGICIGWFMGGVLAGLSGVAVWALLH